MEYKGHCMDNIFRKRLSQSVKYVNVLGGGLMKHYLDVGEKMQWSDKKTRKKLHLIQIYISMNRS
jgi:hypothetical protein